MVNVCSWTFLLLANLVILYVLQCFKSCATSVEAAAMKQILSIYIHTYIYILPLFLPFGHLLVMTLYLSRKISPGVRIDEPGLHTVCVWVTINLDPKTIPDGGLHLWKQVFRLWSRRLLWLDPKPTSTFFTALNNKALKQNTEREK